MTSKSWTLATTVFETLLGVGVTDVVYSPGSRNAGLGLAAVQAERCGLIKLHVRVDERVAGFTAIGLAKASGRPVPVITTSGSAVGNLMPAVMEASHSRIPIVVVSADRPQRLHGSGANQTTNQIGMFSNHVVDSVNLDSSDGEKHEWAGRLFQSLAKAVGVRTNHPGPIQINLQLDVPVLPESSDNWIPAGNHPEVTPIEFAAATVLSAGPKTVLLAGDGSQAEGQYGFQLAKQASWPLLAEPSSNARTTDQQGFGAIENYRLLLPKFLAEIERVIMVGHPTLSRPVSDLLAKPEIELVVLCPWADWPDPGWRANIVASAVELAKDWQPDNNWLDRWLKEDQAVSKKVSQLVDGFTGPNIANTVIQAQIPGANLVLAASNIIRDADLAPVNPADYICFANRGLAGIDGTVSTATGIALGNGNPTTLLIGDLAFCHDIGGLAQTETESRPNLRIIVVDDHGGSIFSTLEQGEPRFAESFERAFATAQTHHLATVAAGFGLPVRSIDNIDDLRDVLAEPIVGTSVIICQTSRSNRRELAENLAWIRP